MKRRSELVLGGVLVAFGVLWLLDAADVIGVWRWGVLGPLLVIAVGAWRVATSFGGAEGDVVHRSVDSLTVLGDRRLRCDGPFEGGSIVSVLADVELDLTSAVLSSPTVELATTAILGDLDIVVPRSWRVRTEGPVVLADVEVPAGPDASDAEGLTSAAAGPVGSAPASTEHPELVIRTFSLLSDLTVRTAEVDRPNG